jgi:hypothetical protein
MGKPANPSTTQARQPWSDFIWPLLAGTVAAVGVFSASKMFGVVMLLAVYAVLSIFAVVTVWGLSLEFGVDLSRIVRWGLASALAVLVVAGLCQIHPQYGLLVGVVIGLSSPTAIRLAVRARPHATKRRTAGAAGGPAPGVLVDKTLLERRFDDIVSQLRESGDFPEN